MSPPDLYQSPKLFTSGSVYVKTWRTQRHSIQ